MRKQNKKTLAQLIAASAFILPVALAGYALAVEILMLTGSFVEWAVIVFGLVAAGLAGYWAYRTYTSIQFKERITERVVTTLTALAIVLAWVVINLPFNSQHVFTNRDPATYSIAGSWLVEHNSLVISRFSEYEGIQGVVTKTAGFDNSANNPTDIEAQGSHILPAVLGGVGKVFGYGALFNVNILIGGLALLAVFALGRELVGSRWALVAMATLAASLPMIYFSRDTYTEPLSMLLIFIGLTTLVFAMRASFVKHIWLGAGLLTGLATATRVDAYLTIAAVVGFALIATVAYRKQMKSFWLPLVFFMVGLLGMTALGLLDVKLLASRYFSDLKHHIYPELLLLAAASAALVVVAALSKARSTLSSVYEKARPTLEKYVPAILLFVFVILASRPLWLHFESEALARDYNVTTVNWLIWYIGIFATVLGFIGVSLMARNVLTKKANIQDALPLVLFLVVILSTTLLYLVRPSIYPDQIWASRRLLPVIMPGMVIAAAYCMQYVWNAKWPKRLKFFDKKVTLTAIATLMVVAPLLFTAPFIRATSYGQLHSIDALCKEMSSRSTVLWFGIAGKELPMSTRIFCDDVQGLYYVYSGGGERVFPSREDLAEYAAIAREEGRTPLVGFYGYEADVMPYELDDFTHVATQEYDNLESVVHRPPLQSNKSTIAIYVGYVNDDGSIKPYETK